MSKTQLPFTTDKPLISGTIYMIEQNKVKRVVTKESAITKGLIGHWIIKTEFLNQAKK